MEFQATSIADFLNGIIEGDPNATVNNISKIEDGKPGTLAFLANPKYNKYIYETDATIVLVNKDFVAEGEIKATLIRVDNAYEAFASLLDLYQQAKGTKSGIENPSYIDASATVGKNIYIGAFSYIGKNVRIGNNVKIYPHVYIGDNVVVKDNTIIYAGVKIYEDCKIGELCILHAGCVIGADGFGFAPTGDGSYKKIPQVGNVILEDQVEIGANTTVDCATMGSTIIHKGVKLDNLIQIAHNCEVGENTVMAALTGLAGSVKVGKNCTFGGQVGVAGHLNIGNNVTLGAMCGVTNNIKDDKVMLGAPAMDISQAAKVVVVYRRLPQLREQVINLEKELAALKEQIGLK
ncbi:MAG: UDP-3-O-(3-hydroxymyristoyl)glucosamine N-acyltransferase [Bacteroidetes bacterium GWF2_42_66]|nr:MAG: UDP-3-O-(3-hydroxymyristoyl)glucosamine N-acyltransferase [Bacteroidetes bacterium GWA2_42_15]OFX97353.1 MAG: UDP-3-O-(3-hydroxymyristoyl)glucosamine N-acyltransferase [Bacteroidetes bacterium GWE2_42_39]OFY39990.1 MAG: UDP-3-O-(3-hydroxymyristoyl)glucosamine N-acyltransferase [Bacteroidetes bacterium GWF2_42_66]HBL78185.1 UDP-3-O-(3-hydroxymyristoyl)glucosamine N-acyltransferase [Prolixibacteraceae bacterium]HCR89458.1 UDP-3-O-(3-hydroxymyristoyl)glucosamine N-acyltransferase [Prolixib